MKKILLSLFCILPFVFCSTGIVNAGIAAQESEEVDLLSAVSIFSELLTAGVSAAGTQIMSGYTGEPATAPVEEPAPPEELPTETDPEPVISEPEPIPEDLPTEVVPEPAITEPEPLPEILPTEAVPEPVITDPEPAPLPVFQPAEAAPEPVFSEPEPLPEAQPAETVPEPPQDPESVSVSTGIEVKDYYDTFKANVKALGRHSVSFEEKGKKSSSKVEVDDDIELYLRYRKEGGTNMIDRITFEEEFTTRSGEPIFSVMLQTLCDFLNIEFDAEKGPEIYKTVSQGGSLVYSDLLLYGIPDGDELEVRVYYTGSGYVEPSTTTYSKSADEEFHGLIEDLKERGTIPESNGSYYFHEDYQQEWARINWLQWQPFDTAKNFVISTDISWMSASRTPNYSESGCGFLMRQLDSSNYLSAGLRLDGKLYIGGMKNGSRLSYGTYSFGTNSYKGNAQLVLVASGNKFTAYVDGARMGKQQDIIIDDDGNLAFTVWSGTNKDYGIRCTFQNIFYYVW